MQGLARWIHARGLSYRLRPALRALNVDIRPLESTLDGQREALLSLLGVEWVLDGGAHWGEYGRRIRSWGYRGNILSFEPNPESFGHLERVSRRDLLWHCRQVGLAEGPGYAELLLHGGSASPFNSFANLGEDSPLDPTAQIASKSVPIDSLDRIVAGSGLAVDLALLKLDLQGWEAVALRGATNVLDHCLAVEVEVPLEHGIYDDSQATRSSVFELLRDAHFEPVCYHTERWFDGRPPDMDVLFRRT